MRSGIEVPSLMLNRGVAIDFKIISVWNIYGVC